MHKKILLLLSLICCVFLNACSTYPIQVEVYSSELLNPDQKHKSLPVVVKIYQLSRQDVLMNATFKELWLLPKKTLGLTLIKQATVVIGPGERKTFRFNRERNTRYLAAVAIFRKPVGNQWRSIKAISKNAPILINRASVSVVNHRITIR